MKLPLILLLLLVGAAAYSQCGSGPDSFDVYYGYRSFSGNFYNQFSKITKPDLSLPLQVVGVGVSGRFIVTRGSNFNGHFTYSKVIPQRIKVQDTLSGKVGGFFVSFGYGTSLIRVPRVFDLDVYTGFNTGRIKITGNELLQQKNPFFSPKIGLQTKLTLCNIAISLRGEYEYDISKVNWRRTLVANENKVNLAGFRQTGITALLGIGYAF